MANVITNVNVIVNKLTHDLSLLSVIFTYTMGKLVIYFFVIITEILQCLNI